MNKFRHWVDTICGGIGDIEETAREAWVYQQKKTDEAKKRWHEESAQNDVLSEHIIELDAELSNLKVLLRDSYNELRDEEDRSKNLVKSLLDRTDELLELKGENADLRSKVEELCPTPTYEFQTVLDSIDAAIGAQIITTTTMYRNGTPCETKGCHGKYGIHNIYNNWDCTVTCPKCNNTLPSRSEV